jgi:hypothetical protein
LFVHRNNSILGWGYSSVVEHLSSVDKALSSIPVEQKSKGKKLIR